MKLNPQQQAAVEFRQRHALVLAGAGSGKTRVIIGRAAHLIGNGCEPRRILMLTFTRRAAREVTERLSQMVGESAAGIQAGTFHHYCLTTMRRMPKLFDITGATVIDRDDQVQLFKLARGQQTITDGQFPKAAKLADLYSYARNTNQPARDYLDKFTEYDPETIEKILTTFTEYSRRKKQSGYLDYDDILFRFAQHLHGVPAVREQLRGLYDHILIDEMQDTNPLQWLILDGLRDPAKLFCVGDDAQSIYAFRGADFKNVHSFTERVPDSTVLRLEENYRSTQETLDVANWLLDQSPLNYNKRLHAARGSGIKPRLLDFDSEFGEARWIAGDLLDRHEGGAAWKDHMVITRTGHAARSLEAAMIEKKIPYLFVGGTSLLQAAHVKDLFALIRSAASTRDDLAWVRYLTLWPRIGESTATRLIDQMGKESDIPAALESLGQALRGNHDLLAGLKAVLEKWDNPSAAVLAASAALSPLLESHYEKWDVRRKDFELLATLAMRHKSLLAFLETYTLEPISATQAQRLEGDDAVTLITVHSAKGTEAPVCYVIRAEPGMYPHVRSLGRQDEEEEERRILYVAMTRAQNELILSRTLSQYGRTVLPGGFSAMHSSGGTGYFLEGLPESLMDGDTIGFNAPDSPATPFQFDDDFIRPIVT